MKEVMMNVALSGVTAVVGGVMALLSSPLSTASIRVNVRRALAPLPLITGG